MIAGDETGEGDSEDDGSTGGSSLDVAGDVQDDDSNNSSSDNRTHGNRGKGNKGSESAVEYKYVNSSNSHGKAEVQKKLYQMLRGTRVVIDTARSGEEYARDKPSEEYDTMVKKGKVRKLFIRWGNDDSVAQSHWTHLEPVVVVEKFTVQTLIATVVRGVEL